ncbi:hypothetical protein GCM10011505_25920 [Tistrella bauzanensis]|uniref:Twin-arginine translocation pathway signal n=1 Tax=Tistrella bauzanensis TaxID=657419 RepID=A0ABQ1ILB9_9PROT|nr:DUF1513 domain-containing protein [Tistrella bauzanensis]GGB43438.1 hypothetical protein GCM10011505_25920 [Tistrella bauzanensis]
MSDGDTTVTRRRVLGGLGAAMAGIAMARPRTLWASSAGPAPGAPDFLVAARHDNGDYALIGLMRDGGIRFTLPLPARGHGGVVHPLRSEAVAVARRPGREALVIDCATGSESLRLTPPKGRVFYGHGAFSNDGRLLFTPENDYEAATGRIGIWDAADGYKRIDEIASGGVGPHEIRLESGGVTLLVANGGNATHPDTGREVLNPGTMQPNLVRIAVDDGRIVDAVQNEPALRLNSIRHLSTRPDGLAAAVMQWQGDAHERPPLMMLHKAGTAPRLLTAPEPAHAAMRNYAGSTAFNRAGDLVAMTSPVGGRIQVFGVETGGFRASLVAADVCGLAADPDSDGFLATDGRGRVLALLPDPAAEGGLRMTLRARHALAFDNHMIPL